MKKSLFFYAAATALMLTACSSEDDILQTGQTKQVAPQEVGFDVYTQSATDVTRAGLEGTMTTSRLQRSEYEGGGFGVYAFQVQDQVAAAGDGTNASSYLANGTSSTTSYRTNPIAPNFMVNEKLLWNSTNMGWYYNPLKYWPNETDNDSQTSPAEMLGDNKTNNHIDRLTFFAYAPYVSTVPGNYATPGISFITNKNARLSTAVDGSDMNGTNLEPSIAYTAALDDPNQAVDLLWGVAPAGGLTYTAVNGKTVNVKEGEPLMDMTKPDVNTNMKFLFQHALARIGVTAVAAIDQVGAGGTLDPNTKITINKITLTGWFGATGILNLDNEKANVANWYNINGVNLTDPTVKAYTKVDGNVESVFNGKTKTTLILEADNTKTGTEVDNHQKGTIARHLQFVNVDNTVPATNELSETPVAQNNRVGVTTVRQNVIMPASVDIASGPDHNRPWYTAKTYTSDTEFAYSETTPYYTDPACDDAHLAGVTMPKSYTTNSAGQYIETAASADKAFKYPMVLENLKRDETFTEVTSSTKSTYASYNAYSNYRAVGKTVNELTDAEKTDATDDYAYISDAVGYQKLTADGTYQYSNTDYKDLPVYTKLDANVYIPKAGAPKTGDYVVANGMNLYKLTTKNKDDFKGYQLYTKTSATTFTPKAVGSEPDAATDYVICGQVEKVVPYYKAGTYYKRDNNYFMVVPTNNITNIVKGITPEEEVKLRTVRVMIEYYITTKDSKLANGLAQTKNVIEKDVVFPSIANGKSYNLNLILGLTSVKMEAEVDDWKVINVQGDLPQNTATE